MLKSLLILGLLTLGNAVDPGPEPPCPSDNSIEAYFPTNDCAYFWQCSNGSPYLMPCGPGTHWSQEIRVCVHIADSTCTGQGWSTTEAQTTSPINSPSSTESTGTPVTSAPGVCPPVDAWDSVYFPDKNCSKFWQCSNGAPIQHTCPGDLHFNPILNVCDYPEYAGCQQSVETTVANSQNATTTSTPSTTAAVSSEATNATSAPPESTTNNSAPGVCPPVDGWDSVYFPDKNCSKFWQCSNGVPIQHTCPEDLHFNPVLNVCDYPEYAGCQQSVETTVTNSQNASTTSAAPTTPEEVPTDTTASPTTVKESTTSELTTTNATTTSSTVTTENPESTSVADETTTPPNNNEQTSTTENSESTSVAYETTTPGATTPNDEQTTTTTENPETTSDTDETTSTTEDLSTDTTENSFETSTTTVEESTTETPSTTDADNNEETSTTTEVTGETTETTPITNQPTDETTTETTVVTTTSVPVTTTTVTPSTTTDACTVPPTQCTCTCGPATDAPTTTSIWTTPSVPTTTTVQPEVTTEEGSGSEEPTTTTEAESEEPSTTTEEGSGGFTTTTEAESEEPSTTTESETGEPSTTTEAEETSTTTETDAEPSTTSEPKTEESSTTPEANEPTTTTASPEVDTTTQTSETNEPTTTASPEVETTTQSPEPSNTSSPTPSVVPNTTVTTTEVPTTTQSNTTVVTTPESKSNQSSCDKLSYLCPAVDPEYPVYIALEDCEAFCQCSNGAAYYQPCPANLHFNPNKNVCDYPQDAGCTGIAGTTPSISNSSIPASTFAPTSPNATTPSSTSTVSTSTASPTVVSTTTQSYVNTICQKNADFTLHPHPDDCSRFIFCSQGEPIVNACPEGQHFSTDRFFCTSPEEAKCGVNLIVPNNEASSTSPPESVQAEELNDCQKNPTQFFLNPHPTDCSLYTICNLGNTETGVCSTGLHFSPIYYACMDKEKAGCTSAAPLEERIGGRMGRFFRNLMF